MTEGNRNVFIGEVMGRPVDLTERAPSFTNEILRVSAREYYPDQIVPTIQYLISDTPIDKKFWRRAGYDELVFEWEGKKIRTRTNHGLENCMNKIIDGKLDISELILDLSWLLGSAIEDKNEMLEFKKQIQAKAGNGIKKKII